MNQIKTTLYSLNKDGSFQQWKVFVQGDEIFVEFGKLDGKIQTKITKALPKNVGRSNETTGEQQAVLEAISKWEKQVRTGYRETTIELDTVEQFSPMLAHDGTKRSHDIIYPCYVQPKLDGLRCLVTFDNGTPVFNSRGNKTYPIQGVVVDQVKILVEGLSDSIFKDRKPMLDGELYIHGLSLQKIGALAKKWRTHETIAEEIQKDYDADVKRRNKAIEAGESEWKNWAKRMVAIEELPVLDVDRYGGYESADLQFHVFDIPDANKCWWLPTLEGELEQQDCRYKDMFHAGLENSGNSHIIFVSGQILKTEEEVKTWIGKYMEAGYEGIIVRNFKGVYEFNFRSSDLIKWKIFKTIEVFVIGYEVDKNGEVLLHCVLQNGVRVNVKMKGTHEYQKNCMYLVGRFITISFQDYTDDGVPTFARGIAERNVDPDTWEVLE